MSVERFPGGGGRIVCSRGDVEGTCSFDDVRAKRSTEKALLVTIEGEDYWIPHSQITDDSEVFDDGEHAEGTLVITEWIARQKNLAD